MSTTNRLKLVGRFCARQVLCLLLNGNIGQVPDLKTQMLAKLLVALTPKGLQISLQKWKPYIRLYNDNDMMNHNSL